MSLAQPPSTDHSSTAILHQRLETVRKELVAQRQSANLNATLTGIIGSLLLAGLAIYFYIGYVYLANYTKPEYLVPWAETTISDNLPEATRILEQEIVKSAPSWAENLSKQMRENLPTARKAVEDQILSQFDGAVVEATKITDEQFSNFIKKNRPLLEQKFKELATRDKLADASLKDVEEALDAEFKSEMKEKTADLLQTLRSGNAKLARLQEGKKLTTEEQLERHILMLARRIRLEQGDPSLAGKELKETAPPHMAKPIKPAPVKPEPKKPAK